MKHYDSLIVSDLHLGSSISLANDFLILLKNTSFSRLILLGDIFQDLNFSRLTKEHWKVISYLRKLSNPKRNIEIVWIEGNHDIGISQIIKHFIGIKVYTEYSWDWNGKKCIALHGHQFDDLYADGIPWVHHIFVPIFLQIQKIDWCKNWLPGLLDKFHTHWQRLSSKVEDRAFKYAASKNASFIFCGHTHQIGHKVVDGIEYWNSGHWTGTKGTFITISNDKIELDEFSPLFSIT